MWFAFKMYLWLIDKHYDYTNDNRGLGCDLLSKCIFDLLINTDYSDMNLTKDVVICFQNVSLTYW